MNTSIFNFKEKIFEIFNYFKYIKYKNLSIKYNSYKRYI